MADLCLPSMFVFIFLLILPVCFGGSCGFKLIVSHGLNRTFRLSLIIAFAKSIDPFIDSQTSGQADIFSSDDTLIRFFSLEEFASYQFTLDLTFFGGFYFVDDD